MTNEMTNEEAIAIMTALKQSYINLRTKSDLKKKTVKENIKAYDMAIKALEQGDVLQNVKQEISTIPLTDGDGHNGHWFRAPQAIIKDVNVIIDKFINEVEQ